MELEDYVDKAISSIEQGQSKAILFHGVPSEVMGKVADSLAERLGADTVYFRHLANLWLKNFSRLDILLDNYKEKPVVVKSVAGRYHNVPSEWVKQIFGRMMAFTNAYSTLFYMFTADSGVATESYSNDHPLYPDSKWCTFVDLSVR